MLGVVGVPNHAQTSLDLFGDDFSWSGDGMFTLKIIQNERLNEL